ncbi:MAG TPA: diguanylate cyclase [Xanthomonadaceae bacterium]
MTSPQPDPSIEERVAKATHDLSDLKAEADEVGARLIQAQADHVQLSGDIRSAEQLLESMDSGQLMEANQNLVFSSLRAQAAADHCAEELKEVSRSAELDVLTALPNRGLLLDRFAQSIAGARRDGYRLALLFVDMNNFKSINDSLGHAMGDQVLQIAARRMVSVVREVDTVSRHGGDEFLILLNDIASASDAELVAQKVSSALEMPCQIGEHVFRLAASIGICLYPDDGDTPQLLIDRADAAMYRAKRLGSTSCMFHADGVDDDAHDPAIRNHPINSYDIAYATNQRRASMLREANEQLVMAALSAQDLQAAAEHSQQRQKEFLALVAHELRNPLTPLGVAVSLLRGSDAQSQARMQRIIEQQLAHMSRLIGDLLDLSRSSTGKLRLHFRDVDLLELINDVARASRHAMDTRLQRFHLDLPLQPITLVADPIRLSQILSNLLDNASKYTPEGGEIHLTAGMRGENVVISVADNGIGISAAGLWRVFEPFAQDTHAMAFNGQGLGIGLTVVKELVEGHGGTVDVVSAGVGLGSEFVLTLPLKHNRDQEPSD